MDDAKWRRNLSLYLWQRAGTSFLVYIPISLAFYLQAGLSLGEIGLLNSLSAAVLLLADLPAGYVADRFSYKPLLMGGIIVQGTGFALMGTWPVFWMLVVAHVLMGFGEACRRSADDVIARRSAVLLGRSELFTTVYARRAVATMGVAEGTAALLVSAGAWWLGPVAARLMVLVQALIFVQAAVVASRMHEPPRLDERVLSERKQPPLQFVADHTREFWHIVRSEMTHNPKARWLVLYGAAIGCTTQTVVYLVQPYFRENQLPLWAFALIWAPYHFAWALFAWQSARYVRWLGRRVALGSLVVLGLVANIGMVGLSHLGGLIMLTVFYFIRGVQMPTVLTWLGDVVPHGRLATILSLRSTVQWGMFVVMNGLLGYTTQLYGTRGAFMLSGVVYACLGFAFLMLLVKEDTRQP